MDSKSQIGIEFFILVGLAFLIAIFFVFVSLDQLKEFRTKNENDATGDLSLKLQKEMLIAAAVEDGYIREFTLPQKLDSVDYTLTTKNSTITVQSKNSFHIVAIPKVVGNVSKGSNKINKTRGVIYIN